MLSPGCAEEKLIGLLWQVEDFENLILHIRRSVVAMVEGAPKTEASLKNVPLDAQTAESLWAWRHLSPHAGPSDWVFASPHMKGRQPYWPGTLWRYYGKPALRRAKVTKQVSYHTFRHYAESGTMPHRVLSKLGSVCKTAANPASLFGTHAA